MTQTAVLGRIVRKLEKAFQISKTQSPDKESIVQLAVALTELPKNDISILRSDYQKRIDSGSIEAGREYFTDPYLDWWLPWKDADGQGVPFVPLQYLIDIGAINENEFADHISYMLALNEANDEIRSIIHKRGVSKVDYLERMNKLAVSPYNFEECTAKTARSMVGKVLKAARDNSRPRDIEDATDAQERKAFWYLAKAALVLVLIAVAIWLAFFRGGQGSETPGANHERCRESIEPALDECLRSQPERNWAACRAAYLADMARCTKG